MAQFLVPSADVSVGSWTPTPGWSRVDEGSNNFPNGDGLLVTSDAVGNGANTTAFQIGPLITTQGGTPFPPQAGTVTIRVRWNENNNRGLNGTINLYQGDPSGAGTVVATLGPTAVPQLTEGEATYNLTSGEISNITDWGDLYLEIIGTGAGGGPSRNLVVDLVEVQSPDASFDIVKVQDEITQQSEGDIHEFGVAPWITYHPNEDTSSFTWASTPLWSKVDDDPTLSSSESDVITANGGGTARLGLPTLTQPKTFTGWRIRVRARVNSGTKTLRAFLVRKDNGGEIARQDVLQTRPTLTASYQWFELPLLWSATVNPASIALSNFAISLVADGINLGEVAVAAVELRIPNLGGTPFGNPGFSDIALPPQGRSGPHTANGKRWMVGVHEAENVAWAFSATTPSDGHNPGEWTREFPVGEVAQTITTNVAISPTDRGHIVLLDSTITSDDELLVVTRANVSGYEHREQTYPTNGDPPTDASSQLYTEAGTATHVLYRGQERSTTPGDITQVFDYVQTTGLRGRNPTTTTIISGSHTLFDAVFVPIPQRWHVFYSVAADDLTSGIRQRTWRANGTLQTAPGSDATSEDHARLGVGMTYRNGSSVDRVISPHPQVDGGGITALALDSGDSPTPNLEIVTTRNAYDAAYEQSVIAVGLGTNLAVVLWIDASADAIWAASREDGQSSWVDQGQQVFGSAGRTRLSAEPVNADTVALLVAAGSGDIEYYEFDIVVVNSIVKVQGESLEMLETDLSFVEEATVSEFSGWGIPIGIQ